MNETVRFLDNTLREGEQVPGVWFSWDEKVALFEALQDAGINLIDTGIPVSSPEVARFCRECVKRARTSIPGVSIRAFREEIDLAAELGAPEIFIMFPFSEIHITRKFSTDVKGIKARCKDLLNYAVSRRLRVGLVAEDASRGSLELVCDLADYGARHGAARIFLCDTVGAAIPTRAGGMLSKVREAIEGRSELGVHCHNDFGLATANTLAAVEAGADIVCVTVNGLGERAGNAPLHEVALALSLLLKLEHDIVLPKLPALSAMAERFSGVFCSPLAPVVGRNAFRHESGIHVDGILKESRMYEELQPEVVGRRRELVLGTFSGIGYLRVLLNGRGIDVGDAELRALQERIRAEVLSHDKSVVTEVQDTLEKYYQDSFGFPMERFWELVREVLPGTELDRKGETSS